MVKLSNAIEPTTRAFLESINAQKGPALYELPVEEGRAIFAKLQDVPVTKLPVDIEERAVPGSPTGEVPIRTVRPKGASKLGTVIYTHGAGWVFGDKDVYDRLVRDLAHAAKAAMVFVDYTRSPRRGTRRRSSRCTRSRSTSRRTARR